MLNISTSRSLNTSPDTWVSCLCFGVVRWASVPASGPFHFMHYSSSCPPSNIVILYVWFKLNFSCINQWSNQIFFKKKKQSDHPPIKHTNIFIKKYIYLKKFYNKYSICRCSFFQVFSRNLNSSSSPYFKSFISIMKSNSTVMKFLRLVCTSVAVRMLWCIHFRSQHGLKNVAHHIGYILLIKI